MHQDLLSSIFPSITPSQIHQLLAFEQEISSWNQKINLISRKDIHNLFFRHILPSLAIGKIHPLRPNSSALDVGTGGGFPGIPLAILFPQTKFHLVDSIGKKIHVVQSIIHSLNLKNASASQLRIESHHQKYDYVLGRSVTNLHDFLSWVSKNLRPSPNSNNGVLYLKGGDFSPELPSHILPTSSSPIKSFIHNDNLEDKSLLYFTPSSLKNLSNLTK